MERKDLKQVEIIYKETKIKVVNYISRNQDIRRVMKYAKELITFVCDEIQTTLFLAELRARTEHHS